MIRVPIDDPSRVGEARRLVAALARRTGFGEGDLGRVGIVSTELATNLARHATADPELLASAVDDGDVAAIDILAVDRGPGGERPHAWLTDGFTTAGSPGTGLGAVRRAADAFEIQSAPGLGTVILARIAASRPVRRDAERSPASPSVIVGAVSVPIPSEIENGDGWATRRVGPATAIVVVDGLGHGSEAHRAAETAVALFCRSPLEDLVECLRRMDDGLRPTRGAAAAVALIDPAAGELRYAGIGNISGSIVGPDGSRSLVSHNGTLGQGDVRPREFRYPVAPGSIVVMHSDGVRTHWTLDRYPGITRRAPSLIAGVLYRDERRGRDDVTIVVGRVP